MRLARITKIRGHRVFRDFAWQSDLHTFSQFNVIYGWNGCGKTTLSSLLALVEKRAPLSEGQLEFEFDSGMKISGTEFGSASVPQVRVFNRDFVNATLQSAGSELAPIYFLGEENAEKQLRIKRLKEDLVIAHAEVTTATNDKDAAERKLDEFCKERAKLVKEVLTTGHSTAYNNYDKRRFRQAAQALTPEAVSSAFLADDEKARLRCQKDGQPKNVIPRIAPPLVDLAALAHAVDTIVNRSIVAVTLAELAADTELTTWVQHGLRLHAGERESKSCHFCLQPIRPERRSALEAHFNQSVATFQGELDALLSALNASKLHVSRLQLPELSRLYDHLVADANIALESAKASAAAAERALDELMARVQAKRNNPFASVPMKPGTTVDQSLLTWSPTALNTIIDQHNQTTEDFQRSVKNACELLERSYVAEAYAEYAQLAYIVKEAGDALKRVKEKPISVQRGIEGLEREILEHRRPAEELTEELRSYLGRDELRFEVKDSGYALTRSGQPVSHLSEGERTAIAFLYFLKSLQDKTFDMTSGIVVIDDPVSSLDANALFSAFGYMKERTKQCGQLFIFTHSFPFFRLAKNWIHHLPNQKKKNVDSRPGRFFLLRSHRHSDGTRTSRLGPLDRLLEEYESEYQYLFKRVYDEAYRTDVDSLEHHYGLPNVARRLIEAFLAFRFPDLNGELAPRLERVNFDSAKKTRILRLLNTYSHAGTISDPGHDLSLLAETQPVLRDVLEMMKAADKEHYEGLERLIVTVNMPEEAS